MQLQDEARTIDRNTKSLYNSESFVFSPYNLNLASNLFTFVHESKVNSSKFHFFYRMSSFTERKYMNVRWRYFSIFFFFSKIYRYFIPLWTVWCLKYNCHHVNLLHVNTKCKQFLTYFFHHRTFYIFVSAFPSWNLFVALWRPAMSMFVLNFKEDYLSLVAEICSTKLYIP